MVTDYRYSESWIGNLWLMCKKEKVENIFGITCGEIKTKLMYIEKPASVAIVYCQCDTRLNWQWIGVSGNSFNAVSIKQTQSISCPFSHPHASTNTDLRPETSPSLGYLEGTVQSLLHRNQSWGSTFHINGWSELVGMGLSADKYFPNLLGIKQI